MKNSFKNILYNAFGFIFPIVIVLITTPYIVHKLTTEIYGVYVLAISIIGVMSFLDLGFGQGIIKFVSQYEGRKDYEKINKIIGMSFFIYIAMGLVGFILIFTISDILAKNVFKISAEYVQTASLAFKITAFGFFINFIKAIFLNIPKAVQRYDVSVKIQNSIWFCSTITIVVLLYSGKGLIEVLIAYIFFQLIGLIVFYNTSRKILPTLKISICFDKSVFKEVFGFSIFTAISSVGGSVIFRVDKMIIGRFLGTEAVAYYQIPFMMVQMANSLLSAITDHLIPASSSLFYSGKKIVVLQNLYKKYTKYILLLSTIINSIFLILGQNLLRLWMGIDFAERTGGVIPFLSIIFFFMSIATVGIKLLYGLGYSKVNMFSSLLGLVSYMLAMSFLIPKLGILGAPVAFSFVLISHPIFLFFVGKIISVKQNWTYFTIGKCGLIMLVVFFLFRVILNSQIQNYFIIVFFSFLITLTIGILGVLLKLINIQEIKNVYSSTIL